jgi:hypothetical protein
MVKKMSNNIIYTAVFFNTNEVVSKYKQVHPNLYSHHSTIEFKPTDVSNLPIGEEINIKVIGRLTNDKVDALIVSNPLSKNKFPHITLSTAEGIKPFQSNTEIENNKDKIKPINDNLIGTVGYFDGRNEVTEKQTQLEGMEVSKKDLENQKLINQAHKDITRTKGNEHAPDVHEIQKWINNPKKLREDAEDATFIGEISKGELEEEKKKKADRCLRIARSKMPQTSAYRSGNIVRCRQGKIWKGLKEEEENNIDKRKIYVLVGPPSVGKSTWIKNTFGSIQPYVISRDNIVEQISDNLGWTYDDLFVAPPQGSQLGDYDEKYGEVIKSPSYMSWQPLSFSKVLEANNQVHLSFTKLVSNAVNSEKDIVVDMTNMTAGARKNALKAIQGNESLFEKIAVVFPFEGAEDIIIDVARKRAEAAKRMGKSKTLPDSVMRKMFASFQNVTPDEGFDKVIQQDNRELLSTLNEKTDFSKEKKQGLHGWFARQGGKGKSKGWVDCNTCRDGKCKSCGRKEGESRSKYPACRPTPSACKTKGKGDSWGKKSTNEDILNEQTKQDIQRELKLNEIKNTFKRLLK